MRIGKGTPMDVEIDDNELHMLCEIAINDEPLNIKQRQLLNTICYHMIWDDLLEKLEKRR